MPQLISFILSAAVVLSSIVGFPNTLITKAVRERYFMPYAEENLVRVEVSGKSMYMADMGGGNHTIVIIGGHTNGSTRVVAYNEFAQRLSEDYRVIIVDELGHGFSDESGRVPRTPENIAAEIHAGIKALGVTEKVILMPYSLGGRYAMQYILDYPEDVEAIAGVEEVWDGLWNESDYDDTDTTAYQLENLKYATENTALYAIARLGWNWAHYASMVRNDAFAFSGDLAWLQYLSVTVNYYNWDYLDEINRWDESGRSLAGVHWPQNLPVISVRGTQGIYMDFMTVDDMTNSPMITNPAIQRVAFVEGAHDIYMSEAEEPCLAAIRAFIGGLS